MPAFRVTGGVLRGALVSDAGIDNSLPGDQPGIDNSLPGTARDRQRAAAAAAWCVPAAHHQQPDRAYSAWHQHPAWHHLAEPRPAAAPIARTAWRRRTSRSGAAGEWRTP